MNKLMLLLDGASEFDRRLLRGLVRYTRENGDWLFFRVPLALQHDGDDTRGDGERIVEMARNWGANAIVGRWLYEDTSRLASLGIPVVIQNYRSRSREFSNLTGDYIGTGRIAARFFRHGGFVHFAYFGVKDVVWSEERKEGFERTLAASGDACDSLMIEQDVYRERDRVARWLHSLPKPVALFCCDDAHALSLSEICQAEGIAVPGEVAILGVDNDELLCGIAAPEISSIGLDVERAGYILGQRLHNQILEGHRESFSIVVQPGEIVVRDSTGGRIIRDPYVREVVDHIRANYMREDPLQGVLSRIPLSRRSLEMRFRKEMAPMTMYRYLLSCRVEALSRLLSTTNLPLAEAAARAGFADGSNVGRIFRRFQGCSPKEFRDRSAAR